MGMIQAGRHLVTVREMGMGKSPKGQTQAYISFRDVHGDTITWYTSLGFRKDGTFSKPGFDYAVKAFRAAGFDAEKHGNDFSALNWGAGEDTVGTECEIVVEDEVYEGKTHTRVKWVNDLNGGMPRMDKSDASSFQSQLRAALAAEGVVMRTAKPPSPPPAQVDDTGLDDIPF